jgi:hypothetical protein
MAQRKALVPLTVAALLAAAACGTSSPHVTATTGGASLRITAEGPPGEAAPVPGSDGNKYVVGPFTITMLPGETKLPASDSCGSGPGATLAIPVTVADTSDSVSGYAIPELEFVKGHSLKGQVVTTADAGSADSGCSGGGDNLDPGQSRTLYAPVPPLPRAYYTWQLTSVTWFNAAISGANLGTTVHLEP